MSNPHTEKIKKALAEKGYYGTLDRLNHGKITIEQAEGELSGTRKPHAELLKDINELLIFGRTWEEIQAIQNRW